jgi:hypothetical protein
MLPAHRSSKPEHYATGKQKTPKKFAHETFYSMQNALVLKAATANPKAFLPRRGPG